MLPKCWNRDSNLGSLGAGLHCLQTGLSTENMCDTALSFGRSEPPLSVLLNNQFKS